MLKAKAHVLADHVRRLPTTIKSRSLLANSPRQRATLRSSLRSNSKHARRQRSSLRFSKDVTYLEHTNSIPIGAITGGGISDGGNQELSPTRRTPEFDSIVVPPRGISWKTSVIEMSVTPALFIKLVEALAQMMAIMLQVQLTEEDYANENEGFIVLGQEVAAFEDDDQRRVDDLCDVEWDSYHLVEWPTVIGENGFTYTFDNWGNNTGLFRIPLINRYIDELCNIRVTEADDVIAPSNATEANYGEANRAASSTLSEWSSSIGRSIKRPNQLHDYNDYGHKPPTLLRSGPTHSGSTYFL